MEGLYDRMQPGARWGGSGEATSAFDLAQEVLRWYKVVAFFF